MKRVILLGVTMAFAFGCLVGGGVKAVKAETIELKMAHFMPPMHIQHQKSFVPFAQNVEKLSNGKVKIKIYSGGALGGPKQLADAVKTGITDIAFIIPSYTTGRFPRTSVFDLPFLFDNAVHATNGIYDMYDRYLAEDYKDYKVLWLYSFGAGQLHSVTKPIHTIDDLKGMKIRSGTAYMSKALELLGANPVGMPVSKLSISLQKKVIDGVLTPYCAAVDFKLLDLLKYITQADMYVSPMAVVMNKEKFDSLPEFAQKAIDEASPA
ncbi:MAG: TRAP transporter substrate-binding protein [Deltaproteobacteria bacterium]|nr:TRAP transporter substrate-binding protein [Deltaproteobacteria bacterium]